MTRTTTIPLLCISLAFGAACSHSPEPQVTPTPASTMTTDNGAAERVRLASSRRDSIARADAARRDATARADADRRARDASAAQAAADAARTTLESRVYFDFNKDDLHPDALSTLDAKAPVLVSHSAVHIRIEGNADDRGSDEYNLALGQRRAANAKRYLVSHGVDGSRIETASYGEERPVCKEEDESCWHQNRRDEFVISAGADALRSH